MRHLILLVLLLMTPTAWADARYDVLIVSDSGVPTHKDLVLRVRRILEKTRAEVGLSSAELPVDQYDIRSTGQKVAIQRLHLETAKLPLLAVCSLGGPDGKPVKVLQTTDIDANRAPAACIAIMGFATRELGVKLPYLGMGATKITPQAESELHLTSGPGVLVLAVLPHSPADVAGVRAHDVLESIDGTVVASPDQMTSLVHVRKVGDVVTLKLRRGPETLTVKATLVEAPSK